MSRPREVVAGRTYLVTRRCTQRQFLLRPGPRTNQAFLYCLAEAAQRFGMEVVCAIANSNHWHGIVRDPRGCYPEFIAHFHRMIAKVMNAHWGRWEALWASEQTSMVDLVEPADRFEKMVYTLTNPVKDHLVARAAEWPGVTSLFAQLHDRPICVRRPHWFFDKQGTMPVELELRFHRLAGFENLPHKEWADKILAAVADAEKKAEAERQQRKGTVLGRKTVLRQSAFARPASHEPRRTFSPRVAAHNKWRRIETMQRDAIFQARYRDAFEKHRAGIRDVLFPQGTYRLRVLGLVRCAAPPS